MILVGGDPEVFMLCDGQYFSAHGAVEGDKFQPYPVENGAVQVDGMALEFNIDPADTEDVFLHNIESVLNQLRAMVPEYEVVADPVATFTEEYMKQQPEEALELGCEPDFNAWTGRENEKPDHTLPFRTGAGHVHFGWGSDMQGPEHLDMCGRIIREADFRLGLPSLLFDGDTQRRAMYGKAGAYRPKSYGAEYRVLSNVWLRSPELIRWVFRASQDCAFAMRDGTDLFDVEGDVVQDIINNSNIDAARHLIEKHNIQVPEGYDV